jgi:hypothetical protein
MSDTAGAPASRRRWWWAAGGVVFLGVAAVAVSVSAWPGMVAALMLAALQFVVAVRLSTSATAAAASAAAADDG